MRIEQRWIIETTAAQNVATPLNLAVLTALVKYRHPHCVEIDLAKFCNIWNVAQGISYRRCKHRGHKIDKGRPVYTFLVR